MFNVASACVSGFLRLVKRGLCGSLASANVPHEAKASGKKIKSGAARPQGSNGIGLMRQPLQAEPCVGWT